MAKSKTWNWKQSSRYLPTERRLKTGFLCQFLAGITSEDRTVVSLKTTMSQDLFHPKSLWIWNVSCFCASRPFFNAAGKMIWMYSVFLYIIHICMNGRKKNLFDKNWRTRRKVYNQLKLQKCLEQFCQHFQLTLAICPMSKHMLCTLQKQWYPMFLSTIWLSGCTLLLFPLSNESL